MKAKLKGANGFVRFLLTHGEKLGIAAVLAVAGLLIYSSLGREKLGEDNQPPALEARAKEADDRVKNMTWQDLPEDQQTDHAKFASRAVETAMRPVPPDGFPNIPPLDSDIIEPIKLRADPVMAPLADLEVQSGAGLWMQGDPVEIKKKMLAFVQEQKRLEAEAEAEAERMRDDEEGGRRGRRRRDRDGGDRYGRGYGDMGDLAGMKTKDNALVIRPTGGAPMEGVEVIRNESWVTVLAKVPIKQQYQLYEDALANARNFNAAADRPRYMGYIVERAEITEAGQGKWVKLPSVTEAGVVDVIQTWPIRTPELVSPKYVHPLLTFPLPPMVMREWGDEVTHSDLPLPTPEELMGGEPEELAAEPEEEVAEGEEFDAAAERRMEQATPYGGAYDGRGGEYGGGIYGGERGGIYGGRGGEYGGGMYGGRGGEYGGGMYGGRGGEYGGGYGMGRGADEQLEEYEYTGQKFALFRYFDSTVEPGHRYRYRVRLGLWDVNAMQPEKFLDKEVGQRLNQEKVANLAKKKKSVPNGYVFTEWSEPSPVAVVPLPGLVYVATAEPARNVNAEPEAKLVVKSLESDPAAEVAIGGMFTRGAVLNSKQKAQIIWSSVFRVDPEKPQDSPTFDFLTGLTLVDFEGGEELWNNRDLTAPARALVMDSAGRMMMKDELTKKNEKAVREYDYIMEESKRAALRQRERMDDRGGRGERRGGYGRE